MRRLLLASLTLAAFAGTARAADGPNFFISPMGEPFRGPDAPNIWFDKADANHDGVLTQDEMEADAMRFFATLDRRRDGEIDPDDLEYYETVIAPMIRVGSYSGYEAESTEGDENAPARTPAYVPGGAARFGYFSYPEPVAVADTNFNRGVDENEFRTAADKRFALLDKNGDGKVEKGELPAINAASFKAGQGQGRGHRRGGHMRPGGGMGRRTTYDDNSGAAGRDDMGE